MAVKDIKRRVTRTDVEVVSNLIEDICSEDNCGMTIWVDQDLKEQGRKSRCMSCLMRSKILSKQV